MLIERLPAVTQGRASVGPGQMPLALTRNPVAGDTDWFAADSARYLDEIIDALPDLEDRFHRFGVVTVTQGRKMHEVPRYFWARGARRYRLRLKPVPGEPVLIRLHAVPGKGGGGGGGKGGKSILSIVASIALMAVGTFITGGGLTPLLGGLAGAGTWGAQALAAGVTFLGRLALTLAAKPAAARSSAEAAETSSLGQASASGNVVPAGQSFDYVAGRAKVFPKMASYPLVALEGEDEIVEVSYMLEGPHEITQGKVEGTPLAEVPGLSFLIEDGTNPKPTRMLQRFGYQIAPAIELKGHLREKAFPQQKLANQASPLSCLPEPVVMTSKHDPDEIWVQYLWPAAPGYIGSSNIELVMPLRLQLRAEGSDTWINLPELMFSFKTTGRVSKYVKLVWAAVPPAFTDVPLTNGAWHSFHTVPAQGSPLTPSGGAWTAHTSFKKTATLNSTARVERRQDGFIIYLDPAVFPRGNRWQVWQQRGCLGRVESWMDTVWPFVPSTYKADYSGSPCYSLFHYRTEAGFDYTGNGASFYGQEIPDTCQILRFATVWNRPPLPKAGNATIEVKGRNANVTQLSVMAGAMVKVWNGSSFDGLAVSDNPADHFFHVATGPQTPEPLTPDLVDIPALGQWHDACAASGHKVALILQGREWGEALDAVASAGLAKRAEGRLLSVTRQRDTFALGVEPRQAFNHTNLLSIGWAKNSDPVPDAVRVRFRNRAQDFDTDERIIRRPGLTEAEVKSVIELESEAIADAAQIDSFFRLYLAALWHRDHVLTIETWWDALASAPGDIVWLNSPELVETHASARIVDVLRDGGGLVTALVVDAPQPSSHGPDLSLAADLASIADMALSGQLMGALIMTGEGITIQPLAGIDAATQMLVFETPFLNDRVAAGQSVSIGQRGSEARRCEVVDVSPGDGNTFTLTVVPEAPEMWSTS